jgi:hypothetical protein
MAEHRLARALRRLIDRRVVAAFGWGLAVMLVAIAVNVVGIRIVGDVNGWAHWLKAHRTDFLVWRIGLYGATAWGWWRMHKRARQRDPGGHRRLLRVEVAAVLVILGLETIALLQP